MTPVSYKHNAAVAERSFGGWDVASLISVGKTDGQTGRIAHQLVDARLSGRALASFPGDAPLNLDESYRIQDRALALYPLRPCGWKVGFIHPGLQDELGSQRLSGPIFADAMIDARKIADDSGIMHVPVFAGGSAAIEAEFICELAHDVPVGKFEWTMADVQSIVGSIYAGIEIAGSPVPDINGLGPTYVAADFGNNAGLILGPAIVRWRDLDFQTLATSTTIDGKCVGVGTAASVPGTPLESVRYLLGHLARRGHRLCAGDLISTGATTGVHDVIVGQKVSVEFTGRKIFNLLITARSVTAENGYAHV